MFSGIVRSPICSAPQVGPFCGYGNVPFCHAKRNAHCREFSGSWRKRKGRCPKRVCPEWHLVKARQNELFFRMFSAGVLTPRFEPAKRLQNHSFYFMTHGQEARATKKIPAPVVPARECANHGIRRLSSACFRPPPRSSCRRRPKRAEVCVCPRSNWT